jgi:hypothetical protein
MSQTINLFNNDENDEFALTGEPISYPHDQNTRLNISNYGSNQGFMKIYQNSDDDKKVTVNGKLEINGDLIVYGDLNVSGKIISIQNNIKKLGNFMALTREIPEDVIKIMLLYIKSIDEKTYIECLDSLIYQPHIRLFSEDFILEYIDDVLKNHVGLLKLDNFYEKYLDNMPRLKLLLKLGGDE